MATVGEIELKAFPKELIVQWKIKEFFSLSEEVYYSSSFSFAKTSWCLKMFPYGCVDDGYLCLYLRKKSSGPSNIEFSFSLKTMDEKKVFEKHQISHFDEREEWSEGFPYFLSRTELSKRKSDLLPSDTLTIICTLKCADGANASSEENNEDEVIGENKLSKDEEDIAKEKVLSKMKGLEILSDNLKQMFLDGRMTDAILKTNGQEFSVHKNILVARSPVFASMFQHELAEKKTNEVDIPDCAPESFEIFLHYQYSGSAERLSTSTVCNVYYAADKYQVDDLKENCVSLMAETISVETFCDVIALSLRHGESNLQKLATDFFRQNIKTIIKTVQWQRYMDENSTQANELLIKALNA